MPLLSIATESAVHKENPEVVFIEEFLKIVGRFAIAYETTEFKLGIIPDSDIPIISNSLREGAQKFGFPIFEFTVHSGGIIPTGMPNTNTTKNADTYAGTASQLVETNGAFELDTKKGSDTVAMIVYRQKTRIRMGNGDDAGFFIVMPDCELIVDGGVGSNQITAVIMPGGKITYTNFAQELTKIIDLSGKDLGDGPRIASSLNSDFDPLNNSNSTNSSQTLQFVIAQDNPNFGNNDILFDSPNLFENKQIQSTFGNVNELNGEIFNSNNPNQESKYLNQNPSQNSNQFPDQNANFIFQSLILPSSAQIFVQNTVNRE